MHHGGGHHMPMHHGGGHHMGMHHGGGHHYGGHHGFGHHWLWKTIDFIEEIYIVEELMFYIFVYEDFF